MVEVLRQRLTDDDDPELWDAVIRVLTEDVLRRRTRESDAKADWFFQIGACSHWARPHQTRWPAAGGFAWPSGYKGGAGHGYGGLPEFNWSVTFRLFNSDWEFVEKFAGRHQRSVRVAVPTRTRRHRQAAIHTAWMPWNERMFYGFRARPDGWECVAVSDEKKNGAVARSIEPGSAGGASS